MTAAKAVNAPSAFRLCLGILDLMPDLGEPCRGKRAVLAKATAGFGGKADGRRQRESGEGKKHRHAEHDIQHDDASR